MRFLFLCIIASLLMPAVARAASAPATTQSSAALTTDHCFLLHLPGIGGKRSIDRALVLGLQRGGIDADVDIYDWTGGPDKEGLPALANDQHHREEADKIAKLIVDQAQKHPEI